MSDRLWKLKQLETKLFVSMQTADIKSMAAIARQYRETIKEIEEIEGADVGNDSIADILSARQADGDTAADC